MKGSASYLFSCVLQEKVLQFPCDTSDVENTISSLHPFKIDGNDTESVSKEKVGRGSITMDQHLLIFPHARLFTPAVTQPGELIGISLVDAMLLCKLTYQVVKVATIFVKIYSIPISSTIVECSQEVSQGGKLFVESIPLPAEDGSSNDVAEWLATTIFPNQQAV